MHLEAYLVMDQKMAERRKKEEHLFLPDLSASPSLPAAFHENIISLYLQQRGLRPQRKGAPVVLGATNAVAIQQAKKMLRDESLDIKDEVIDDDSDLMKMVRD